MKSPARAFATGIRASATRAVAKEIVMLKPEMFIAILPKYMRQNRSFVIREILVGESKIHPRRSRRGAKDGAFRYRLRLFGPDSDTAAKKNCERAVRLCCDSPAHIILHKVH